MSVHVHFDVESCHECKPAETEDEDPDEDE